MNCPKCGYAMGPFDRQCPRCKLTEAGTAPGPAPEEAEALRPAYSCPHCGGPLVVEPVSGLIPPFCGHCGRATTPTRQAPAGIVGYLVVALAAVSIACIVLLTRLQTGDAEEVKAGASPGAVVGQASAVQHMTQQAPPSASQAHYPPPPAQGAGTWVRIASWSGDGTKTTETFSVMGDWAIEWVTSPGRYGEMNFQIFTYTPDGALEDVDANIIGAGHDVSHKHAVGTYYLKINSGQSWRVAVWEKR